MFDIDFDSDSLALDECSTFKTAPALIAEKVGADLERFCQKSEALVHRTTPDLLSALETQSDPAMLWPIHRELHRRGIPPILRGPRHQLGIQGDFIDFASDVLWLQLKWSGDIQPKYKLAKSIFKCLSETAAWWGLLHAQFARNGTRNARGLTIAFRLHDYHRHDLRLIQTLPVRLKFFDLHGHRFGELFDALMTSITERPDKSRKTSPRVAASRRARILRIHLLTGQSYATTAALWLLISGEARSRQAIRHQVEMAAPIAKQLRKSWDVRHNPTTPDVPPAVIPEV